MIMKGSLGWPLWLLVVSVIAEAQTGQRAGDLKMNGKDGQRYPVHSEAELRFVSIGLSEAGRLPAVAYTERDQRIRIISAREATAKERREYESKGQS